MRRDPVYWQRLRKDVRSNVAAGLAALAALLATVSVISLAAPGTHYQARGSVAYWLLMLPLAWWVAGLATFAPFYVRSWRPVMLLAVLAAGGSLLYAITRGGEWGIWAIGFGIVVSAAAGSLLTLRGSLVGREGPAR